MEMLQGVWKQHLRPRAVVGYDVKIFLPSPPNYVTRSPGMSDLQIGVRGRLRVILVTRASEPMRKREELWGRDWTTSTSFNF